MAYDAARSDLVLLNDNGSTWTWDGSKWMAKNPAHSPGPRIGEAMAYDSARHVVILYGGAVPDPNVENVSYDDMWTWDGTDWTQVS